MFSSYRHCSYVSPWSTRARSIAPASAMQALKALAWPSMGASPRRLQNTCLEPSDASHVYTSARDHSFAFQFRYTLGLDTIAGANVVTFNAPAGVDVHLERVLGGFGATIDKEAFDGVPAVQKRGKVVVRLGHAPPSPPSPTAEWLPSHIGGYIGGEGAPVASAASAAEWLRTHGSHRVPVLPAISADEYARTHFAPLDGAAGAPVAAAAQVAAQAAALSVTAADEHARTLPRSGTATATDVDVPASHGRNARREGESETSPQSIPQGSERGAKLALALARSSPPLVTGVSTELHASAHHSVSPEWRAVPPSRALREGVVGVTLEVQGTLSGEGLELALRTQVGAQLALLLLPQCERPEAHAIYMASLRHANEHVAPPPARPMQRPTPTGAAPLPPPPGSYSYDPASDEGTNSYDQTSSDDGTRGELPSRSSPAHLTALGLGAADGSVQLPNLDDSLSALLAKEEAAALAAARLGKLRVPPPPPPPPPPPFHSLHLSLSSVHEADVEDESLAAKLAQLAPRLRSPTDGDSAVSADGSAVRKWLRAWLADVLTTRIVLVFIALQLAAGVIVWSRRRRCGRSSSAREPPLPLSQACDPGGSGDDSEVDETFDETEDGAARESRQSTESGFIGQRCSLHCSSRDSGGMRHALILHGHARAGADSEWDDGHEETGVLSACGAPQRNARSQDMD